MKVIKIQDILNIKDYKYSNQIKFKDIVGKSIVILSFEPIVSKKYNKNGYKLRIIYDKNFYDVYTYSYTIVQQLNDIKTKLQQLNLDNTGIICTIAKYGESLYFDEYTKLERNKDVSSSI